MKRKKLHLDGFQGTTLSEKAYLKRYTLFDSIYITSLKWQNYTNGGEISGCQGLEGARKGALWLLWPEQDSEGSRAGISLCFSLGLFESIINDQHNYIHFEMFSECNTNKYLTFKKCFSNTSIRYVMFSSYFDKSMI